MAKRTISAKEILTDIKAGMDDAALMQRYGLPEKNLQSVFKKLVDAGVLENSELDKQMPWFQPNRGNPANHQEHLEPVEALATASQGPLQIAAENT